MPRKTTILIVILAIITGVLIFLAVRSDSAQQIISNNATQEAPTPTSVQPYATLSFATPTLDASTGSLTRTADIVINTSSKPVAGAQVELSYDPLILSNVKIVPATNPFFGPNAAVLINSVDPEQGRISYAVGISPQEEEKTGSGVVMQVSFTLRRTPGVSSTSMTFLTKSAITTLSSQESILLNSTPLQILLSNATPTSL